MKLMKYFQWAVFRNNQSSLPCKFIVFEGNFYTYISGFAGRDIKLVCICSNHCKYVSPFYCCIGPYYAEICIFIIQILFSYILVFLRKGVHKECKKILEMNVNFSY